MINFRRNDWDSESEMPNSKKASKAFPSGTDPGAESISQETEEPVLSPEIVQRAKEKAEQMIRETCSNTKELLNDRYLVKIFREAALKALEQEHLKAKEIKEKAKEKKNGKDNKKKEGKKNEKKKEENKKAECTIAANWVGIAYIMVKYNFVTDIKELPDIFGEKEEEIEQSKKEIEQLTIHPFTMDTIVRNLTPFLHNEIDEWDKDGGKTLSVDRKKRTAIFFLSLLEELLPDKKWKENPRSMHDYYAEYHGIKHSKQQIAKQQIAKQQIFKQQNSKHHNSPH